jgi:uncharacterized membrane protein YkvA (DUF1232 family)
MLYQMVNKVCTRINNMDVEVEAPLFSAQLQKRRPRLKDELFAQGIKKGALNDALLLISKLELRIIKGIPPIAGEMSRILQAGEGESAFRCILAASLAYLVQPGELIPDDLPGGYGLLDDALLLHEACALSWEAIGNNAHAEEDRKLFQAILICVPEETREMLKSTVSSLAITLNLMRSFDPMLAEMTAQALIANPLQGMSNQTKSGAADGLSAFGSQMSNYASNCRPTYSWQSGNSMGINFPGGGGVASDGRDVFIL